MTVNHRRVRRALTGGFISLVVGFLIALLITGFHIMDALIALLWCLPFIVGLTYIYMRERPGSP